LDDHGNLFSCSNEAWKSLWQESALGDLYSLGVNGDALTPLEQEAARQGILRLYVHDPLTKQTIALRTYVKKLLPWQDYHLERTGCVNLTVTFPRARVAQTKERSRSEIANFWDGQLQKMPKRHAATYADGEVFLMKTLDMAPPDTQSREFQQFRDRVIAINSQSPAEIRTIAKERDARIQEVLSQEHTIPMETKGKPATKRPAPATKTTPKAEPVKPTLAPLSPSKGTEEDDGSL
jgi:hypothetical protein